jgi:hypothetical protein
MWSRVLALVACRLDEDERPSPDVNDLPVFPDTRPGLGSRHDEGAEATSSLLPDPELAAAGLPVHVTRKIELDPGIFVDGQWVGANAETVQVRVLYGAEVSGSRGELTIGWNTLVVRRACGPVRVPVRVDPHLLSVSVPYLACTAVPDAPVLPGSATRLDRRERTVREVGEMKSLGLLPSVPLFESPDDDPARWITLTEAREFCAFHGGRLPTRPEWEAAGGAGMDRTDPRGPVGIGALDRHPAVGPAGHEDLDGNVAEWVDGDPMPRLIDGGAVVVGGSWLRSGRAWTVPASARSEEIGFRCAYDAGQPGDRGAE